MVDVTGRAHITINDGTTLQQLKSFTDQLKDDQSVRAVKTKDGILLYAKDGKSSKTAQFFGIAENRRSLAQKHITALLGNHAQNYAKIQKDDKSGEKAGLFGYVSEVLHQKPDTTPKGATLKAMVNVAFALHHSATGESVKPGAEPETSKTFGTTAFKQMTETTAKGMASPKPDRDQIIDDLAGRVKTAINTACGGDPAKIETMLREDSPQFRRDLERSIFRELTLEVGMSDAESILSKPSPLHDVIDRAVEKASGDLLGFPKGTDQQVKVGNDTYTFKKDLAEGGYGRVMLFSHPTKGEVVVKIPRDQTKGLQGDNKDFSKTNFAEEFLRHKAGQGDPAHPNVVAMLGGVVLPDGRVGIIMEKAKGDGVEFMSNTLDALGKNLITAQEHKENVLTVFQDVAKGVAQAQARGIIHSDLKPDNIFGFDNGTFKIADWGTAQTGGSYVVTDSSEIATSQFLAPELNKANTELFEVELQGRKTAKGVKEQIEKEIISTLGDNDKKANRKLLENPLAAVKDDSVIEGKLAKVQELTGSPKADTWQCGVLLFRMITGKDITEVVKPQGFKSDIEKFIASMPDGQEALGGPNSFFQISTGDPEMDTLINSMLVKDPALRPTMDVVLQDPIFIKYDIGSREQRDRIDQLGSRIAQHDLLTDLTNQLENQTALLDIEDQFGSMQEQLETARRNLIDYN